MVARGRRGRGRGRGLIRPSLSGSDEPAIDEATSSPNHDPEMEENESCVEVVEVEDQEVDDDNTEASFAPMITKVVGAGHASAGVDWSADDEEGEASSSKGAPNGSSSSGRQQQVDSTSNEFEFTVDDTEMAEFDADDVGGEGRRKRVNPRLANHRDDSNSASRVSMDGASIMSALSGTGTSSAASPSTMDKAAPKVIPKKSKRKFGLEYIVVSLNDEMSPAVPPSMKESPHECVLCLPGQSFNATLLAKHIHSVQHLRKVLELHSMSLFEEHGGAGSAEELHAVLCGAVPEPSQPVKLLVVPSSKLEETRARTLKVISARKESLATCSAWSAGGRSEQQQQKRQLMSPSSEGALAKRSRPCPQEEDRLMLMVGDCRAQDGMSQPPNGWRGRLRVCPEADLDHLIRVTVEELTYEVQLVVMVGLHFDLTRSTPYGSPSHQRLMRLVDPPDFAEIVLRVTAHDSWLRRIRRVPVVWVLPMAANFVRYNEEQHCALGHGPLPPFLLSEFEWSQQQMGRHVDTLAGRLATAGITTLNLADFVLTPLIAENGSDGVRLGPLQVDAWAPLLRQAVVASERQECNLNIRLRSLEARRRLRKRRLFRRTQLRIRKVELKMKNTTFENSFWLR